MLRRLRHLFDHLLHRGRVEAELNEEVEASFAMTVDRFVAQGMSLSAARRAARIEFEGVEQVKEKVRDGLVGSALLVFFQDARYAWRGLCRRPSFAFIALLTLALGIGVNTAVFSVFHGILLHPLPYDHPERLVRIWASYRDAGYARAPFSGPMLGEIERRNLAFAAVAGIWVVEPRILNGGEPEQVKCARVTANLFDVLGVRAAQGRTFIKEDTGTPAVMLTDGIFRRRFLGNPELLGKGLPTAEGPATLAGVLPAGFQLQFAPDANIPADVQIFDVFGPRLRNMSGRFLRLVARLKPGVTLYDAQRDLDRVAAEMRATFPAMATNQMQLKVAGLQEDAFGDIQPALTVLFAGAAFVLSICCVNVTSLLLARASDRRKEIALRLTLGASRGRILRQLLAEAFVLCLFGGVLGVGVGWAGFRGLLAIRPERLARIADARLSWPVLAFAAAASLAAALVFALVPAIESFRVDLIATLRAGGRGWLGRLHRRAGGALVVGEIALGFVLVTSAALTARSLAKVEQVHPGFEPRHLLTFQFPVGYSPEERRAIVEREAELAAVPGVELVGAISHLPLDQDLPNWYGPYRPQGITQQQAATTASDFRSITPGYFAVMGARLIEGRYFDQQDRDGGRHVLIIDEVVARSAWPGESPLGRTIEIQGDPLTVVGVVEHVRNHSLTEDVRGVVYFPVDQSPRSPLTFILKTSLPPLSLVPAVRATLREHNPNLAMGKIRPMTGYVERAKAPAGFTAVLAAIFGVLALLLAATGIYGVLNYQVSRRLPEMGIRAAVGASTRDLLGMVLREGLVLAASGVLLGGVCALAAGHWLGALLYGVSARDPLSYGLAVVLLPAAALLGCWLPARRAATASPADMIEKNRGHDYTRHDHTRHDHTMIRPVDLKDDDVWKMFQASWSGDLDQVKALVSRRRELALCEYNYTPPIHFAVREGHLEMVRFLLEQGADPTYRTYPFHDTLLTMAQDRDHHAITQLLREILERQFPVTEGIAGFLDASRRGDLARIQSEVARDPSLARASDDTGDTALHRAAIGGHLAVMHALLDADANADAVRADGKRPVHCALDRRNRTALRSGVLAGTLLSRGAEYNIYLAAVIGDDDYVREALARDPALSNFEDSSHQRPISAAARRNDLEMVELLLEHGADPSLPEEGAPLGEALWVAVYQKQPEMAKMLLEHGANPNTAPESSGPALLHARKDPELRALLLEYGAREDTSDRKELETLIGDNALEEVEKLLQKRAELGQDSLSFWGEGILSGPANSGNREMIELLIRYGARVPEVSKWAPYYYFKHTEIAVLLLERGMNPNHMNWHHFTLLHHMAAEGDIPKARLLLDHGADINTIDEEYRSTPLGCAARRGQKEMVELLLERGADPNLAGATWATPLAWARKRGHTAIEADLRLAGAR